MNKEIDESPYCEVCGTCGCIGCCGIRNFISEHIEGKTNCKNEGWIIQDLINLCDYKDEVFKQNEKLHKELDYADNYNIYLIAKLDKIKEYIENEEMPNYLKLWNIDKLLEEIE